DANGNLFTQDIPSGGTSPWSVSSPNIYYNVTDGKVGIGIIEPTAYFHLYENLNTSSSIVGGKIQINNTGSGSVIGLNVITTSSYEDVPLYGVKVHVENTSYDPAEGPENIYGGYFIADPKETGGDNGMSYGVYAEGNTAIEGIGKGYAPTGVLGSGYRGVYGIGAGTGDNFGVLGFSLNGKAICGNSTNGYAGYFQGKSYFSENVGIGVLNPSACLDISKTYNTSNTSIGTNIQIQNTNYGGITGLNINATSGVDNDANIYYGIKASMSSTDDNLDGFYYGGYFTSTLTNTWDAGESYGIYAKGYDYGIYTEATDPEGLAAYFNGDASINGDLIITGTIKKPNGQPYSGVWNTVTGGIYYNSKVGIGTDAPKTNLNVKNTYVSNTQTNFTQSLTNAGILITTTYTDGTFTPGLFWSTDHTADRPKAGIYLKATGTGTYMYLGTSDEYAVGIKNNVVITPAGTLEAKEIKVKVEPGSAADFVFEEDYNLRSLQEVEAFIKENKHLPDVAPAKDMEENGVNLSEQNQLLLQKIEELTLYIIEQQKEIEGLKGEIKEIKQK
ncbi:MAG: hypothetical protein JXB49_21290, partial [Bacteroidales bacterium]|nr:hypothetical protein [Bacteroidales bacterium]